MLLSRIKTIIASLIYLFANYIVAYIPSWTIRKVLYRCMGMKIGHGSRIYMKCIVRIPWRITIGNNTIINENCYLDGRGGITIGDNVSVSFFSFLISASHDSRSGNFKFVKDRITIKDNAWIGANAIILQGTTVEKACILAAGSTLKGNTEEGYIYAGIPAVKRRSRELQGIYTQHHIEYFR